MEVIKDYGWCKVLRKADKNFLIYDGGGVVVEMKEVEITKDQFERALKDQNEAEKVLMELLYK